MISLTIRLSDDPFRRPNLSDWGGMTATSKRMSTLRLAAQRGIHA